MTNVPDPHGELDTLRLRDEDVSLLRTGKLHEVLELEQQHGAHVVDARPELAEAAQALQRVRAAAAADKLGIVLRGDGRPLRLARRRTLPRPAPRPPPPKRSEHARLGCRASPGVPALCTVTEASFVRSSVLRCPSSPCASASIRSACAGPTVRSWPTARRRQSGCVDHRLVEAHCLGERLRVEDAARDPNHARPLRLRPGQRPPPAYFHVATVTASSHPTWRRVQPARS